MAEHRKEDLTMGHILRSLVVAAFALAVAAPARAQVTDQLKCYKVKDALKLAGTADLDTPRFGVDPGCKISKAKFFCVPGTETNVAAIDKTTKLPITPVPVAGPDPGTRVCYQVKCPKPPTPIADEAVTDQFGNRTLTKPKASLLCAPATLPAMLLDAPCGAGLVCRFDSSTSSASCRTAGTGAQGTPCGVAGDAACGAGLVCRLDNSYWATCQPTGLGLNGNGCSLAGDAACGAGLVCRPDNSSYPRCQIAGTGADDGTGCGVAGDAPCDAGLVCRPDNSYFPVCQPAGTGDDGTGCGLAGDAPCNAGLVCRSNPRTWPTCQITGTGADDGTGCGLAGDVPCGSGLVCRPNSVSRATCRTAGTGADDGTGCGLAGDAACGAGLVCRPGDPFPRCIPAGTGANSSGCGF